MELPNTDNDRLPHSLLAAISRHGGTRNFAANTVLIHEGDVSDSIFILLSGRVKAYSAGTQGREIVLDELGPGHYVGELALDGDKRSVSIKTLEPTTCCVVQRDGLDAFLVEHPEFAGHLTRKLIRMVRRLTEQVKSLALQDVYGRVTRVLMELSDPIGDHVEQRQVRQRLTQQDIADRVGSSREMVHRVMKELAIGEYVVTDENSKLLVIRKKLPHAW
ncbi:Crp/Fnr family transcriptional regulator [Aquincola sp. S2]|uniref:Crp/Fnr family transcriptional regulator n=1 Tax=Pseudaquabacterium terrae TaxID=2732868 RepID=A0ABX2ENV3_9BURK|nr:Crp/Fnr family transcriptional regulator [Aquabacterium terrae]NRF70164.1 Crp/Fnr family transcriptional regulator [Aquabacterium terrae]